MNILIRDITKAIKGQLVLGDPKTAAGIAAVDSRLVEPGALFFALKGAKEDGHQYALKAIRRGAAGVVVSQLDWMKGGQDITSAVIKVNDALEALKLLGRRLRADFKGPVIGITGSNGKTTTKEMTASILKTRHSGLYTSGNYNSQIGLPLVLSQRKPSHEWMVLEMGASEPGNIASLADMARPTMGIITSIGPAHLATFGSIRKVAETKWELIDSLPSDGCAILPWGDPNLDPLVRGYGKRIVFFGEDSACAVRATSIQTDEQVKFLLHIGSQNATVRLPVPGRYNVWNAMAAAAAGWVLGYSLEEIVKGLEGFQPPSMRMQVIRHSSGAIVINDAYNANPASTLQSVRSMVESFPKRKKVAVVGSMLELGDESDKFHFHIGTEIGRYPLEHIYCIGEETKNVLQGAISVGAPAKNVEWIALPTALEEKLEQHLKPDTVILFKGSRGMALERFVNKLEGSCSSG